MNVAESRQLDPEGTRTAILEAARKCFIAVGFAATSMTAVAKGAGVTKSLIHHHFGSKRELWEAVKDDSVADYHAQQSALLHEREPDLALIEESMVSYFRFLKRNPDLVRLGAWMAVEEDAGCHDVLDSLTAHGIEVIREGQKRGHLRDDIDAAYLMASFFTLVRGWFTEAPMLTTCLGGLRREDADEDYLRAIVRIYLRGVAPVT